MDDAQQNHLKAYGLTFTALKEGMPAEWLHNTDELYDNMRGPIENVHLLATAYSKGTNVHEPMIWTVRYGKGRVFHTPMGHDVNAMRCVGFQATLQRGTEWAATGQVTQPLPSRQAWKLRIANWHACCGSGVAVGGPGVAVGGTSVAVGGG